MVANNPTISNNFNNTVPNLKTLYNQTADSEVPDMHSYKLLITHDYIPTHVNNRKVYDYRQ